MNYWILGGITLLLVGIFGNHLGVTDGWREFSAIMGVLILAGISNKSDDEDED